MAEDVQNWEGPANMRVLPPPMHGFFKNLVVGWAVWTSEGWGLLIAIRRSVIYSLFHVGCSNNTIYVSCVTDVGLSVG